MSHGEIKALRRSVWREDRERSFEVPLSERGRLPEVRSPTTARSSNARASRQDEVAAMRIEIARQRRAFQANIQRQKEEAAQKRETRMREAAERNEATRKETRAEQTLRREEREKHAERMREMVYVELCARQVECARVSPYVYVNNQCFGSAIERCRKISFES